MQNYKPKSKAALFTESRVVQKLLNSQKINDRRSAATQNLIRQCNDLTLINDINLAVIHQKPLSYILGLLSRSVGHIFNSNGVAVYLLSDDGNFMEMQPNTLPRKISQIVEKLLAIKIPKVIIKRSPDSIYFRVLDTGKPIYLDKATEIHRLIRELTDNKILQKQIPAIRRAIGINHVLIFPLISAKSSIGIMDLARRHPFSDSDIQRLQQIVSQVTEAILYHQAILEKENLLQELQAAYDNMKKLSGLIPICSHCKKIRDDSGYWNQVEKYIAEHSNAVFSHGICPDCMQKYYPEFVKKEHKLKK